MYDSTGPDGGAAASGVAVDGFDELRGVLTGTVIEPGMPEYDAVRRPAMARFRDSRPLAVIRAASEDDVASTLRFARRSGLHVVPRGGGHCFAGRSATDGVVLDLTPMRSVSVATGHAGVATIGAGARLAEVYDELGRHGLTLPAGCGADVGIAGLTLGGGLGLLGRRYGLTCDRLRAARVVLPGGVIVDCDERRHPDLFWALRGAGGGQFGVVTSLVFDTVPAPQASRFVLTWSAAAAPSAIAAWQDRAPDAPDEVNANLKVFAGGDGGPVRVILFGAVLAPPAAAERWIGGLVALIGKPATASVSGMGYRELKGSFDRLVETGPPGEDRPEPVPVSKSEFARRSLPAGVIAELLAHLVRHRVPGQDRELNFTPMGGAYNRVPSSATAFVHREERFVLEHVSIAAGPATAARDWVRDSHAIAHPWASGRVYPNFPDPDLTGWAEAYHGGNHGRLAGIKRRYDPERFLRFHQSL